MEWDEIIGIENPYRALKEIEKKIEMEDRSIQEMEDMVEYYEKYYNLEPYEMWAYPNGGRVLDGRDVLSELYTAWIISDKCIYCKGQLPVFLTYERFDTVLNICEKKGLLDTADSVDLSDECCKKREQAILACLEQLKKDNQEEYLWNERFRCYGVEAKYNFFPFLCCYCSFYLKKEGLSQTQYIGFKKLNKTKTFLPDQVSGEPFDPNMTLGKRFYLCFGDDVHAGENEVYIDTGMIEILHGSFERFMVLFKNGMVLRGRNGKIGVSYVEEVKFLDDEYEYIKRHRLT